MKENCSEAHWWEIKEAEPGQVILGHIDAAWRHVEIQDVHQPREPLIRILKSVSK